MSSIGSRANQGISRSASLNNTRKAEKQSTADKGSALSAATISFTGSDTIEDSDSGLAIFAVGDNIEVSGSASNNREFKVVTSAAGTLTVEPTQVTTEASYTPSAPVDDLAGAGAGNLTEGVYSYKVTFVTAEGESSPSAASGGVTVADAGVDGQVSVTSIPTGPANVTARKLYRTEADGSEYKLVTTIADNSTTTYEDNIADASLGADAPTENSSGLFVQVRKV